MAIASTSQVLLNRQPYGTTMCLNGVCYIQCLRTAFYVNKIFNRYLKESIIGFTYLKKNILIGLCDSILVFQNVNRIYM